MLIDSIKFKMNVSHLAISSEKICVGGGHDPLLPHLLGLHAGLLAHVQRGLYGAEPTPSLYPAPGAV